MVADEEEPGTEDAEEEVEDCCGKTRNPRGTLGVAMSSWRLFGGCRDEDVTPTPWWWY